MKAFKKLLAAGLALALPISALAQTTPAEPAKPAEQPAPAAPAAPAPAAPKFGVTLYGTLNVNLQASEAHSATNSAQNVDYRFGVSTDSSNIGVRATADLTHGLGAVAQCETSANVDGISVSGICNRNSRVGLSSAYGTLFYGNWDSPYKAMAYGTKADDPFGNTDVFGWANLMGSPGFNTRSTAYVSATTAASSATAAFPAGAAVPGFDLRVQNSVAYHSPKWNGVSTKLQYSTDEFATNNSVSTPRLYSAVLNFDFAGLSVAAAWEGHEDAYGLAALNTAGAPPATAPRSAAFGATVGNAATISSFDQAWRVAAGYELASPFGATTVLGAVEQLRYKQDKAVTGSVKEYNRMAYQVGLKHRSGNHELRARWNLADKGDCEVVGGTCSTSGYGAQNYTGGYAYHLSKAAQVYGYYTLIKNERNAQYTFSTAGIAAIAGATPKGSDPWAAGLGMRYAF